ncbi:hypothetical protein AAMO2058_000429300 [Amorphochlora amoebiformis]
MRCQVQRGCAQGDVLLIHTSQTNQSKPSCSPMCLPMPTALPTHHFDAQVLDSPSRLGGMGFSRVVNLKPLGATKGMERKVMAVMVERGGKKGLGVGFFFGGESVEVLMRTGGFGREGRVKVGVGGVVRQMAEGEGLKEIKDHLKLDIQTALKLNPSLSNLQRPNHVTWHEEGPDQRFPSPPPNPRRSRSSANIRRNFSNLLTADEKRRVDLFESKVSATTLRKFDADDGAVTLLRARRRSGKIPPSALPPPHPPTITKKAKNKKKRKVILLLSSPALTPSIAFPGLRGRTVNPAGPPRESLRVKRRCVLAKAAKNVNGRVEGCSLSDSEDSVTSSESTRDSLQLSWIAFLQSLQEQRFSPTVEPTSSAKIQNILNLRSRKMSSIQYKRVFDLKAFR